MQTKSLFPITRQEIEEHWQSIDDVVMGGRSHSRFGFEQPDTLVFSGEVSLDRGGGFASVRRQPADLGLEGARGLLLRLAGDGRRYKLSLRCDASLDGIAWQAAFETTAGSRQEIRLPLSIFYPTYHGSPRPQAGPLDPSRVVSIGFVIGEKQSGPFCLRVASIAAYF